MQRSSTQQRRATARQQPRARLPFLWWIITLGAFAIPLAYSPSGYNPFRLPKELLLRAEAIAILGVFITIVIMRGPRVLMELLPKGHQAAVIAAIVAWSLVSAVMSSNRLLSAAAIAYVIAALIVFLGTFVAARDRNLTPFLLVATLPALANSLLAILQRTSIWTPVRLDMNYSAHLRTSALLGNPNDLGSYLMPIALMTIVAALVTRRRWWGASAAVSFAGLVASEALTALVALAAGCIALALLLPQRRTIIRFGGTIAGIVMLVFVITPYRHRLDTVSEAWRRRDYPILTSFRMFPIAAAWEMFRDHPIMGIGPGTFKFHYFDYRRAFNERHPRWLFSSLENYGEAHCDHVQVLAEEGIPGYVLFVAALTLVGAQTFRLRETAPEYQDTRRSFASLAAFPLAVGFGVLALAAFPLELAAPTQVILHFVASILAWSRQS